MSTCKNCGKECGCNSNIDNSCFGCAGIGFFVLGILYLLTH